MKLKLSFEYYLAFIMARFPLLLGYLLIRHAISLLLSEVGVI